MHARITPILAGPATPENQPHASTSREMQTLLDAYFASIDAIAFTQLVEEECIAALHAEDVAEGLRVVSPSSDKPKRARESMYVRMFNGEPCFSCRL